ncbi:hypothetical protein RUM44_000043 [Polyplax serrata]|uniref:Uncharacterized protein n=1 Tax=Polyplax serrata TaxID=468196 RepID=A0ABR1B625_POLSC
MYPWYRQSVSQYCNTAMPSIKNESGFSDCMLALDYAAQSKDFAGFNPRDKKAAYVWSQDQNILTNSTATSKGQPHGHGPNPAQGLVHWMSVMAEHMNNVNQENPMHYVWNNMENASRIIKDNPSPGRQKGLPLKKNKQKTKRSS